MTCKTQLELFLADELQQQTVMWGGPCSQSTADALHTCELVPGASEIVKVADRTPSSL